MVFLEGATEEQIAQFEKDNEFTLPEKYKEWLQFSERGLKHDCLFSNIFPPTSFPSRERGLKHLAHSLPPPYGSSFPSRERGLKRLDRVFHT